MLAKYSEAVKKQPSVIIFDNLNALCPLISSEEQANIIDQLKSLKFTTLLTKLAERQDNVRFLGVSRHFMSLNPKLLDLNLFDTMYELQAPSKDQRYSLLKDLVVPPSMRAKELQIQKLAQTTEYFTARDMAEVLRRMGPHSDVDEEHVETVIKDYRH